MTGTLIAVGIILPLGAYLKWGVAPVIVAYEIGRRIERIWPRRGGPQVTRPRRSRP